MYVLHTAISTSPNLKVDTGLYKRLKKIRMKENRVAKKWMTEHGRKA